MSEDCENCGSVISAGSTFKMPNNRKKPETVAFVNFITGTQYAELCDKCGGQIVLDAREIVNQEISEKIRYLQDHVTDFPMFTTAWLPGSAKVKFKTMITANVTVGTGFLSEFSQGFSDFVGAVNVGTGMSHKVNKGEAAARSILVDKAISMGANCILAVDIDYGTTANNAAVVNMQGTAAVMSNLEEILESADLERALLLHEAYTRIAQLKRWRTGDLSP